MEIRIVHTADNHLGKKFKGRYTAATQERLVNERFDALARVVLAANQKQAHFLVIAGDLFDSINISLRDIKQTVSILRDFDGEDVLVLPGNHDFYETGSNTLWKKFAELSSKDITVLTDFKPMEYSINDRKVVFYPCPCTSKHSATNAIGWIASEKINPDALNIGIAHGNVEGKGLDAADKYFNMTPVELKAAGLDCWLLGHIHAPFPEKASLSNPGFLFPATHTPDGFDNKRDGFCWYLQFDDEKKLKMEQITTGKLKFIEWTKELNSFDDFERTGKEIQVLNHQNTLLKLTLTGRISETDLKKINESITQIHKMLLHFECENNLLLQIDKDYINLNYTDNSLPHKLLTELAESDEDNLALQLAHQLIEEAKK